MIVTSVVSEGCCILHALKSCILISREEPGSFANLALLGILGALCCTHDEDKWQHRNRCPFLQTCGAPRDPGIASSSREAVG